MSLPIERVVFRFKSPNGRHNSQPSEALHGALMLMADAEELQPLFVEADEVGKFVSIEVFQSRDGRPLLIHFGREDA